MGNTDTVKLSVHDCAMSALRPIRQVLQKGLSSATQLSYVQI